MSSLTGAVRDAVGDDRRGSSSIAASLVGAVADTVGEGGVGTKAGSLTITSSRAAEIRRGTQEVVDAGLLGTILAKRPRRTYETAIETPK